MPIIEEIPVILIAITSTVEIRSAYSLHELVRGAFATFGALGWLPTVLLLGPSAIRIIALAAIALKELVRSTFAAAFLDRSGRGDDGGGELVLPLLRLLHFLDLCCHVAILDESNGGSGGGGGGDPFFILLSLLLGGELLPFLLGLLHLLDLCWYIALVVALLVASIAQTAAGEESLVPAARAVVVPAAGWAVAVVVAIFLALREVDVFAGRENLFSKLRVETEDEVEGHPVELVADLGGKVRRGW